MTATAPFNLRLSVMQLLAGDQATALSIAAEITTASQWPKVIELCMRWKMLSTLEAMLGNLGVCLPPPERAHLGRRAMQSFVQSNLSIRSGSLALAALEGAGIRCAGFKGVAAIAYLYPGARSRTLQDVDVLIGPADIELAFEILESHGYRRSFPGDLGQYLAFIRNAPGAAGNEAMSFTDPAGGAIDLHWRLGTIDTDSLLAQAHHASVLNSTLPLLRPSHCLLLCVHHALRNDFVPDDIARDVIDFSRWLAYINAHDELHGFHEDMARWGLTQSCLALDAITTQLQSGPASTLAASASRSDVRAARRIADLYLYQLHSGPLNTDLAYLGSRRPWIQMASGLATNWRKYRFHMQQFEALNGEDSLTLTSRARKLLHSAMRVTPARWLQLRALSRAKDTMAATATPHLRQRGE